MKIFWPAFMQSQIARIQPVQCDERLYTIGEAATLLGIAVPTLRLYEREGLIIPIRKSSRHRLYTSTDIERIKCIRRTINTKKISIAGIRQLLSLIPCWRIKNCTEADRSTCEAFTRNLGPCWTIPSKGEACKSSLCRDCMVYRELSECDRIKSIITKYTTVNPR